MIAAPKIVSANDAPSTVTSQTTQVAVGYVSGTLIVYSYDSLPSNEPNSYQNTLFLWQNNAAIPYSTPPLDSIVIPGNSPNSGAPWTGLQIQNLEYVIGYAVGPNVSNICSWVSIPASGPGTGGPTFQTTAITTYTSAFTIVVHYETPAGNLPQTNQQWVGVWPGPLASYTVPPLAKAAAISDNNEGDLSIIYNFTAGDQYTIAYFMGTDQTAMAATQTVTVAGPSP